MPRWGRAVDHRPATFGEFPFRLFSVWEFVAFCSTVEVFLAHLSLDVFLTSLSVTHGPLLSHSPGPYILFLRVA